MNNLIKHDQAINTRTISAGGTSGWGGDIMLPPSEIYLPGRHTFPRLRFGYTGPMILLRAEL